MRDEDVESSTGFLLISLIAAVVAVIGWKIFFFLCDDAFIFFRYAANSLMGRGLVWNPAPFRPVEGYTSFLWLILLREVWQIAGIQPPDSAGVLSLFFGLGTLWLTARFVARVALPEGLARARLLLLALVLAGVVTNRTFLAWLSSGLETALFNFLLTWWLFEGTRPEGIEEGRVQLRLTAAAALCALCRPDGLLIVAATVAQLLVAGARARRVTWRSVWPLLIVPAHMLWRWRTYGDWIPNTYRAKFVRAWPESGVRYLASFILENGAWWWIGLGVAAAVLAWTQRSALLEVWRRRSVTLIAVATVLAHMAYYTLIIGGDHFEYRVYSQLIPLLFLTTLIFIARLTEKPGVAVGLLAGFLVVSWPIPWVHWWYSRDRNEREIKLIVPIADHFPWPVRPVVREWDSLQAWLINHSVGMRQQEHKVFWHFLLDKFPPREENMKFGKDVRLLHATHSVGIPAWMMPNVMIIDEHGLNDWVVAKYGELNPDRQMAHEREPPKGYIECYRTNLFVQHGLHIRPDVKPLTDDEIHSCESRDWSHAPPALSAPGSEAQGDIRP